MGATHLTYVFLNPHGERLLQGQESSVVNLKARSAVVMQGLKLSARIYVA